MQCHGESVLNLAVYNVQHHGDGTVLSSNTVWLQFDLQEHMINYTPFVKKIISITLVIF